MLSPLFDMLYYFLIIFRRRHASLPPPPLIDFRFRHGAAIRQISSLFRHIDDYYADFSPPPLPIFRLLRFVFAIIFRRTVFHA